MTENSNALFGDWNVESLRSSIFHPIGPPSAARTRLWEKVTGDEPESIDSRPKRHITRVVGNVGENNLTLAIQDERIDWVFQPKVAPNRPRGPVFTLGAVEDTLSLVHLAIRCTLETTAVVDRLAFNPVLIKQVADPKIGLKELSKYLPNLDLSSTDGTDFIYQINRRRRSTSVPHVRINRLARWSTENIGGVELRVNPSAEPRLENTKFSFARKLSLDINSDPRSGVVSRDKIADLFEEFVSIADELAIEGDIA